MAICSCANRAPAVLLMPLALALAESFGLQWLPLAMALLSVGRPRFATPVGYQTNALVCQLGGYRFSDFLRVGLPLKLVVGVVTLAMIRLWVPLEAS